MDYFDPQPTGEPWYPIPPDPDEIEHRDDCEDSDMTEPDDEGVRDCLNCGLFEYPDA